MQYNKPPLGIVPNKIWKLKRIEEIDTAILKRLNSEFEIPLEWVKERNDLSKEVETWRV